MNNLLNKLSYLQYPFMFIALIYLLIPYFNKFENLLESFNIALTIMGLGIGFSTLQDTKKVQNEFSRKVYQSKKKTKLFLNLILGMVLLFILVGLFNLLVPNPLSPISLGLISIGIGMLGMLKTATEMAEYQYNLQLQDQQKND